HWSRATLASSGEFRRCDWKIGSSQRIRRERKAVEDDFWKLTQLAKKQTIASPNLILRRGIDHITARHFRRVDLTRVARHTPERSCAHLYCSRCSSCHARWCR